MIILHYKLRDNLSSYLYLELSLPSTYGLQIYLSSPHQYADGNILSGVHAHGDCPMKHYNDLRKVREPPQSMLPFDLDEFSSDEESASTSVMKAGGGESKKITLVTPYTVDYEQATKESAEYKPGFGQASN